MIITELVGNIHDPKCADLLENAHIEKAVLASEDLVKRVQRVTTDHGTELGIRLPREAPDLKDGDILTLTDTDQGSNAVVVHVLPSDVLVIAPDSITQMGFVAHSLGNRHLQAQFFDSSSEYKANVMVVQYDHTVEDFLKEHRVAYSRQERIMPVPFRHTEHSH